ncbi:MAG: phosphotransferase [Wenzhouxiangellaceae bacterium]
MTVPNGYPEQVLRLREELVPAMRGLLGRGLSESFMRQCVRIGEFQTYAGGLKADLVGGLTLNLNAVIKLGGEEIDAHARLMNAVNARRERTFVEVLESVELPHDRWLLLMADLKNHSTLFDLVYHKKTPARLLERAIDKTFQGLRACHELKPDSGLKFPVTTDPFTPRIRPKLVEAVRNDPALAPMLDNPGTVRGLPCPPLNKLLADLEHWLHETMPHAPGVLVHGDPHLRNVMARQYGNGLAVRFIDPNPDFGYTDPVYDLGKLLHFAEPVGWALVNPELCGADWQPRSGQWLLSASLNNAPVHAERRRAMIEREIRWHIVSLACARAPAFEARLHVARASAHLGLLSLFGGPEAAEASRFVLAHALEALARWNATITSTEVV